MQESKDQTDRTSPATQHDLSLLAGHITERLDSLERTMATKEDLTALATKDELARVMRIAEATLTTVQSIDGQLRALKSRVNGFGK